jgi:hypothetical protein
MSSEETADEMVVMSARFFTSPTLAPSGVSDGQMMPYWVGWSLRGWTSLPVFSIGVLMRRRCDMVAGKVMRFRTCATPWRMRFVLTPQLPVARPYLSPDSMMLALTSLYTLLRLITLMSLLVARHDPLLMSFCTSIRRSLITRP